MILKTNERIGYDVMGNINRLQRHSAGTLIDQLKYSYTGNRLSTVLDSNANTSAAFQLTGTTTYTYDANSGNMTGRSNGSNANNLSLITYNHLNLPKTMSVIANAAAALVTYTYDATGNKLKKLVTGGTSLNNEYIGGIHYEDGVLKFVSTGSGSEK